MEVRLRLHRLARVAHRSRRSTASPRPPARRRRLHRCRARDLLRYIASESDRLIGIVDDLLSVARLEAGALEVEPGPTDVGVAIREALRQRSGTTGGIGSRSRSSLPTSSSGPTGRIRPGARQPPGQRGPVLARGGAIAVGVRGRSRAAEITVADAAASDVGARPASGLHEVLPLRAGAGLAGHRARALSRPRPGECDGRPHLA